MTRNDEAQGDGAKQPLPQRPGDDALLAAANALPRQARPWFMRWVLMPHRQIHPLSREDGAPSPAQLRRWSIEQDWNDLAAKYDLREFHRASSERTDLMISAIRLAQKRIASGKASDNLIIAAGGLRDVPVPMPPPTEEEQTAWAAEVDAIVEAAEKSPQTPVAAPHAASNLEAAAEGADAKNAP